MKKIKLHQWLLVLISTALITSCSKKNYSQKNSEEVIETSDESIYTPPPVITITDDRAKSNKDGELYYDNEYGYRYWRYCDGKYYLDAKYQNGTKPLKKMVRSKKVKKSADAEYISSN